MAQAEKLARQSKRTNKPKWIFRGSNKIVQTLRVPEWVLVGGSETGKTIATLNVLHKQCMRHPNAQAAIVRKVRADMDGTVLQLFKENFVDPSGGEIIPYGGEKPEFYIYPNGSRIWVGGMDKPGKVLSGARDHVYVNQAEELTVEDWETLSTRTTGRAGHVPVSMLFGDANPGGATHWILKRARLKLLESYHRDNPRLYTDAGEITEQGRRTMEALEALTGARRERLLLGKWFTPEGIVYSEFDTENLTSEEPDPALPFELAADDGFNDPRCILFIQRTPTQILVFDEIYESWKSAEYHVKEVMRRIISWRGEEVPDELSKWTLEECAKWCKEPRPVEKGQTSDDEPRVRGAEICIGSPEAKEMQLRFKMANIPYRFMAHRIKDRIDIVRRLIKDVSGRRTLKIHKRCQNLINEITDGYKYPTTGSRKDNDNPMDGNDHACDAFGMWAFARARR